MAAKYIVGLDGSAAIVTEFLFGFGLTIRAGFALGLVLEPPAVMVADVQDDKYGTGSGQQEVGVGEGGGRWLNRSGRWGCGFDG